MPKAKQMKVMTQVEAKTEIIPEDPSEEMMLEEMYKTKPIKTPIKIRSREFWLRM